MTARTGGVRDAAAHIWLVTRREIVTRGRSKSYLIGLLVSVVLVAGLTVLPSLFGDTEYRIGTTGADDAEVATAVAKQAEGLEAELTVESVDGRAQGRAAVTDGDLDALLVDGDRVLTDGPLSPELEQLLDAAHRLAVTEQQLVDAGLTAPEVAEAMQVAPLEYESVDPEADDSTVALLFAMVVVLLMMMLLYMPAIYVATGVVEEKSSRVVELLLAAVRPWQLLSGKVLGIGALSFGQLATIAAAGLTAAVATGLTDELPDGLPGVVAGVFVWFLLGYAFYGTLAAASASLVSRQEDVSSVLTPVGILLMASYGVGFYSLYNPGSTLVQALSVAPPVSAVVMPVRTATEPVPGWQVALAIALMILATAAVLALAARVYRRAVLRTGGRLRLRDVLSGGHDTEVAQQTG